MMMRLLPAAMSLLLCCGTSVAGTVLDRVKAKGAVTCAVLTQPDDYSKFDIHGALDELDEDVCSAVAAVVFGDPEKRTLIRLSTERRGFEALHAGKVDVLIGASPDASSLITFGLSATRPVLFDGQALLTAHQSGIHSIADIEGRQICFLGNTDAEMALHSEMQRRGLHPLLFPFEENGEMMAALVVRHCDAVIDSATRLAVSRAGFHAQVKDFDILPERYSVEPMAPLTQAVDPQWTEIVDATLAALLQAEDGGVTRATADRLNTASDPALHGLTGSIPGVDPQVIAPRWAARAVAAVGNYAEMFDRDLGPASALGMERGVNALWVHGGLMYAPSLR